MNEFTEHELKLVDKLRARPSKTTLQIRESCRQHSLCFPLPLFRLYKLDDDSFEAQWNDFHSAGTRQVFRFEDIRV